MNHRYMISIHFADFNFCIYQPLYKTCKNNNSSLCSSWFLRVLRVIKNQPRVFTIQIPKLWK
jgi:hypothetical protein